MSRNDKLIEKACRNPGTLTFSELVRFVGLFDFVQVRQSGSHRIFRREGHTRFNFQEANGMAKIAQVREFVEYARSHGWFED